MDDLEGEGKGKLAMPVKSKDKGKTEEDLRRAQAFHTFASNDVLNFSCWYQAWQVSNFFQLLWSGFQKEHFLLE